MKQKNVLFLLLLCTLFLCVVLVFLFLHPPSQESGDAADALADDIVGNLAESETGDAAEDGAEPTADDALELPEKAEAALPCNFYDAKRFLKNCTAQPYDIEGTLVAATLPHYEPALWASSSLLQELGADSYDTVLVIGPNHSGEGPAVLVSGSGYQTPEGLLTGDEKLAQALLETHAIGAARDESLFLEEWSAAVHMPYLKHYFPNSTVASVLISRSASSASLTALAEEIYALSQETRLLVLFSIDFSHYQSPEVAAAMDEETIALVEKNAIRALRELRGEHLDSPECLSILLQLAELMDTTVTLTDHFDIQYHQNGGAEAGTYLVYTLTK